MDSYFIDIAGFGDTGGDMIELINCFVDQYIFNQSNSIRFLCPITYDQIYAARGDGVRSLVKQIQMMSLVHPADIVGSIQPVITKCKQSQEDLDIDLLRTELEDIISVQFNKNVEEKKENEEGDEGEEDF